MMVSLSTKKDCCAEAAPETKRGHGVRSAFSRASDFGWILAPVVTGVGVALAQDTSRSGEARFFVFVLLAVSLSAGVGLLRALGYVEDHEKF